MNPPVLNRSRVGFPPVTAAGADGVRRFRPPLRLEVQRYRLSPAESSNVNRRVIPPYANVRLRRISVNRDQSDGHARNLRPQRAVPQCKEIDRCKQR
jgi:hypothetical protein